MFRLRKETPDINSSWYYIDLKPDDIVICKPEEMNVKGYDIVNDANAMFNYINNFSNKDFLLERIKKKLKKVRCLAILLNFFKF